MRWGFFVAFFLKLASIYLALFCAQCTEKNQNVLALKLGNVLYENKRQMSGTQKEKQGNVASENTPIMILSDGFLLN